jgi:serine/threonine protein kinase
MSDGPATPVTLPDDDAAADLAPELEKVGNDRYVLDKQIGEGGMGRVFAARDLRLRRPVAVKMLRVRDAALVTRFEREVQLAARLQHPGIVPVYDAGSWPSGEPFLVMKLVLGRSLERAVRDADTAADRLALLPNVIAVAEAVAFAHDQGIVHRDLKPINVLVGAFGETIVLDWGLAKDLHADGLPRDDGATTAAPGETAAGAVLGTPSYMAPEQAAGQSVDARADVYALGAILHHVLSGSAPQATPLGVLEPRLPPDLRAIVEKALAREAHDRYPTAFELAEDLKRFAAGQLVAARRYSPAARLARLVTRHPLLSLAVLVALGLAFLTRASR